MDYPHLMTPQKIRLSREVALVPQLGHDAAITALEFGPVAGTLAALDVSPSVHVWSVETSEVLLIAPLPGAGDEVRWLSENRLAIRASAGAAIADEAGGAAGDEEVDAPHWWVRAALDGDRWRPYASLADVDPGTPWERAPSIVGRDAGLAVRHRDGREVPLEGSEGALHPAIDPLGRFAVAALGASLVVFDADSGAVLETLRHHESALVGVCVTPTGDAVVTCDATGCVKKVDPLRTARLVPLMELRTDALCMAMDHRGETVAVGDADGHVSLISLREGRRLVRTPRRRPGFDHELVLAEDVGFVGTRAESFGAYLGNQGVILPVRPLPAPSTAVCACGDFPEVVFALLDGRIVRVDLSSDRVDELARAPWPLRLVATCEGGIVGVGEGGYWWTDGDDATVVPLVDAHAVQCLAVDPEGELIAFGGDAGVLVAEAGSAPRWEVSVPRARRVAFVRHKEKPTLAVVDAGRVLWRWQPQRRRLARAGTIAMAEGRGVVSEVLSLSADADGALRALLVGDNGHRHMAVVDVGSAQASVLASALLVGHQVIAVVDDEGTWLRQDAERNVRMVSGLRAFEPHDWLRPTEPGTT